MSYSRWSNSMWYTYWDVHSTEGVKNEQIFTICGLLSFSYEDLKENLEGCLTLVKEQILDVTEEELNELKGYMTEFMEDVDEEFRQRNP